MGTRHDGSMDNLETVITEIREPSIKRDGAGASAREEVPEKARDLGIDVGVYLC
jgi:hypothetical protein